MPRQPEDNIDPAPLGDDLQNLWGRARAVATAPPRGVRPVTAERGQEPGQAPGILCARGPFPGPAARGDHGMRRPFPKAQGYRARALGMMGREGHVLLARRRVLGVIEVKPKRRWRRGGAGHEGVNTRRGEAVESGARPAVFEPREGRSTRHVLSRLKRDALDAPLAQGSVPEPLGLIAIRRARRDVREALGAEVAKRMVNRRGRALVAYCSGHAFGEAELSVDATESERPQVGRQGAPVKISP